MKSPASSVELRIRRPDASARNIASAIGFFQPDGGDLIFRSALAADIPVAEHLKWLYGMLQHKRRLFRRLEASGVSVVVSIRVHDRQLQLPPGALLLMHQFHLLTELQFSK
jgi:hypothetical protein